MKWLSWPVTALGPGRRVALWVAGCSLACPGCITPELQHPGNGRELPISRIASRVLGIDTELHGITLTGGEPFEQAGALAGLMDRLKAARPQWSLLAYSGYPLRRLTEMGPEVRHLLLHTDILVAGPYVAGRPGGHPLAGSGNQRVHGLSALGHRLLAAGAELSGDRANLAGSPSGAKLLIGILSAAVRARLHLSLGLTGVTIRPTAEHERPNRNDYFPLPGPLPTGEGESGHLQQVASTARGGGSDRG